MIIKSFIISLFLFTSVVAFSQSNKKAQPDKFNKPLSKEEIAEALNYCKDSIISNPQQVKQFPFQIEKYFITHSKDSNYLCKFYYLKANYLLQNERFDSAKFYFNKILKGKKRYLNLLKQDIYSKLLFISLYNENVISSKQYLNNIEQLDIKINTPVFKGMLLHLQAINSFVDEDYLQAIELSKKAYEKYKTAGDSYKAAVVYLLLAKIYTHITNYPLALEYIKRADRFFTSKNKEVSLGYCYKQIGIIYKESIQYNKALEYLQHAEAVFIKQNVNTQLPEIYRCMGEIYNKRFEFDKSELFLSKAAFMAEQQNDTIALIRTLQAKGDLFVSRKQLKKAVSFYNKAYNTAIAVNNKKLQLSLVLAMSHTYGLLKDFYQADKMRDKIDKML